ncbi:MAG TPA: hypothetical protein VIK10_06215 [Prolixibacteraceae bacterium]
MKNYQEIRKQAEEKRSELFKECRLFFAFSNSQFQENKTPLAEGEKYVSIGAGGYLPKSEVNNFSDGLSRIKKWESSEIKRAKLEETEILYELENHECFYTGEIEPVVELFAGKYTEAQIRKVYRGQPVEQNRN